jgi:hypothetical protein
MVIEMLEAVEDGVDVFDGFGEIAGFVELVAPSAVAALERAVELGHRFLMHAGRPARDFAARLAAGHHRALTARPMIRASGRPD